MFTSICSKVLTLTGLSILWATEAGQTKFGTLAIVVALCAIAVICCVGAIVSLGALLGRPAPKIQD